MNCISNFYASYNNGYYQYSILEDLNLINRELYERRKKEIEREREHTSNEEERFKLALELKKVEQDYARIDFNINSLN